MTTFVSAGEIKVLPDAAGAAHIRNSATQMHAAVGEQIGNQVAPLVAEAIADDDTVAVAAAAAVTNEIAGRDLLETTDPRVPVIRAAGSIVAAVTDNSNARTWLEASAYDGGPTDFAKTYIREAVGVIGDHPSYSPMVSTWDTERATYGVTPRSLQPWSNRLAQSYDVPASVTVIGTSRMMGTGAMAPKWVNSPVGLLRTGFDEFLGVESGTGWVPLIDRKWSSFPDARFARGSAVTIPAENAAYGPHQQCGLVIPPGSDGWVTFTPTQEVIAFWVVFTIPAGGSGLATVSVDGSPVGTVSLAADGSGAPTLAREAGHATNIAVYKIDGLTKGAHTLRIDGVTDTTAIPVMVKGDTGQGVDVNDFSRGGGALGQWLKDDPNHRFGMDYTFDLPAADLVIMGDFTNNRQGPIGTLEAGFRTMTERALDAGSHVLYVPLVSTDFVTLDGPVQGAENLARWQETVGLLHRLSDEYGLAGVIDLNWAGTDYAHANDPAGLFIDELHEGQALTRRIGAAITRVLANY